jgi:hypothetical protein
VGFETHVLRFAKAVPVVPGGSGSGDTTADYVRQLCLAALAIVVTLVWTIAGRWQKEYRRAHHWLRIYVRYALAYILLVYGWSRSSKHSSHFPFLTRLIEPYGDSSPMGLRWTFMGYSKPYTFFAGAAEALAGMLLFLDVPQRMTLFSPRPSC